MHIQRPSPNKKLGDSLLKTGTATESAIQKALTGDPDAPTAMLGEFDLDAKAVSLLSPDFMRAMRVIPIPITWIAKSADGIVTATGRK